MPGPCAPYFSPLTNTTYLANTQSASAAAAQASCQAQGGHLASWGSQAEQLAVEQAFAGPGGCLLGAYHGAYWLGLQRASMVSPHAWLDHSELHYENWCVCVCL